MGMGSYFTIFAKIDISFYIGTRFENDSCFYIDVSLYSDAIFNDSSVIHGFTIGSYDRVVRLQEIPRVSYRDPSTLCLDD